MNNPRKTNVLHQTTLKFHSSDCSDFVKAHIPLNVIFLNIAVGLFSI